MGVLSDPWPAAAGRVARREATGRVATWIVERGSEAYPTLTLPFPRGGMSSHVAFDLTGAAR